MIKQKIKQKKGLSLTSSIILTLLMAFNMKFFYLAGASGLEAVASWIMFTILCSIFFLMMYTGKISKYRRIFFVGAAMFFFPAFISNLIEARGHMGLTSREILNNETPFGHIPIPALVVPYAFTKTIIFPARLMGHYASVYSMLMIWLIVSLSIGSGWCSWVCFFGGWDDGASRLLKKPLLKLNLKDNRLRFFNFAMLGFVVLGSLMFLSSIYF